MAVRRHRLPPGTPLVGLHDQRATAGGFRRVHGILLRKRSTDGMLAVSFGQVLRSCLLVSNGQPRAQQAQLGLFAFEEPQAGAQGFAGILITAGTDQTVDQIGLVTPGTDQTVDQVGLRVRQNDVSRCHVRNPVPTLMAIYANDHRPSNSAQARVRMGGRLAMGGIAWSHFHKDPFDRLLVAQAQIEGITLVDHGRDRRALSRADPGVLNLLAIPAPGVRVRRAGSPGRGRRGSSARTRSADLSPAQWAPAAASLENAGAATPSISAFTHAGRPLASARARAASRPAGSVTCSPWQPSPAAARS